MLFKLSKTALRDVGKSLYQRFHSSIPLAIIFVLLGIMHTLYQGYKFGVGNHSIQIPILKSYFHPELYPNDAMVGTRSYFITFYLMFLASLNRIFGHLELIFFSAHLITGVLFFASIYYLAHAIFEDRRVAAIAVLLMFTVKPLLAGAVIAWDYHVHTYAVLPFILFSMGLFIKGRTRFAYVLLGFSANINIMSVSFVLPMFALVSLLRACKGSKSTGWRAAMLGLLKDYGIFVLFALPCLVWAFAKTGTPMTAAWLEQLRARSSHHSFPFSWLVKDYVDYLVFLSLGLMMWALALRESEDRKIHYTLGWFALVILALCAAGVVFSEYIPLKVVLRMQMFRSTKFLAFFTVPYAGWAIRRLWSKSPGHKMLAFMTFVILFSTAYLPFLVLLVMLYLVVEAKKLYWWTILFVIAALILRVYTEHTLLPAVFDANAIIKFARLFSEDKLWIVVSILVLLWLIVWKTKLSLWLRYVSVAAILLAVVLHVLPSTYHRLIIPVEKRGYWVTLQLWAKQNTPQNAMFITPPYLESFRVYSERGTVVEWKDGTQQFFDTEYSYEWWKRIGDFGRTVSQYSALTPERLVELCRKYGASYIVFPVKKPLPFPSIYEGKNYTIYKPSGDCASIFL